LQINPIIFSKRRSAPFLLRFVVSYLAAVRSSRLLPPKRSARQVTPGPLRPGATRRPGPTNRLGSSHSSLTFTPAFSRVPRQESVCRAHRTTRFHGDQMTFNSSESVFRHNCNPLLATCAICTGTRFEGARRDYCLSGGVTEVEHSQLEPRRYTRCGVRIPNLARTGHSCGQVRLQK